MDKPLKIQIIDISVKQRYDQAARDLKPLKVNDTVRFREGKTWSRHGKIISLHNTPRSYNILSDKSRNIRRNRRHLLPSNDEFCINEGDVEESSNRESDGIAKQKLVEEKNDDANNEENDVGIHDETIYRTRSGRAVKKPLRFGH